jgi:cysteine sulfinate desulfinase/cysteine desulfurase-like protein
MTHMSNVLGTVVDVKPIIDAAHAKGVAGAGRRQPGGGAYAGRARQALGADFYAITGHKLYGPSGSGAIHIKKERMAEMRPFMGGGDMIREVHRDGVSWNDPPMKFEAGTPGIVQQIGLGVALDYMMGVGMENIAAHEARLTRLCARAARWAQLAERAGAIRVEGRDLLLHDRRRGPCPRHLDRARQEGRRGARGPSLRPAVDGAYGRQRHLPGEFRDVQHRGRGRRAGRCACSCVMSFSPEG